MSAAERADPSAQARIDEGQSLVRSLATKVRRNLPVSVDLEDLVAYGQLGLVEAARDFDPEQGSKFTTFAYYRIRGAIYDGVSKMSWMSRARYNRIRYQVMANEALARENTQATDSTDASLTAQGEWFGRVTEKLAMVYLNSRVGVGLSGDESVLQDPAATPVAVAARREIWEKLHELVSALPAQSRRLIEMTYFEGSTLQDAGRRLGISKSWASRLHARILEDLARSLRRLGAGE